MFHGLGLPNIDGPVVIDAPKSEELCVYPKLLISADRKVFFGGTDRNATVDVGAPNDSAPEDVPWFENSPKSKKPSVCPKLFEAAERKVLPGGKDPR